MNILHWWTDTGRGNLKYSEIKLFLCHSVHHKIQQVPVWDWVGVLVRYMTIWLREYPSAPTSIWIPVIQSGANHVTESSWFNNPRACVNIYVRVVPRARITAYVCMTFTVCELGFIIYRYRLKSNQICQHTVTEALHIECREDMVKRVMTRVHKFSKKYSGTNLKILGYNGWHEADSLLQTHTN
jgi:hypothetical protein